MSHMLTRFVALFGLKTKGWKPYFISDKSLPRFKYSGRKTKEIWFDWWQDNLISSSYSYKLNHKLLSTSQLWYKCKNPRWRPYITSSFSPLVLQTYTTAPQLLLLSPKCFCSGWLPVGIYTPLVVQVRWKMIHFPSWYFDGFLCTFLQTRWNNYFSILVLTAFIPVHGYLSNAGEIITWPG